MQKLQAPGRTFKPFYRNRTEARRTSKKRKVRPVTQSLQAGDSASFLDTVEAERKYSARCVAGVSCQTGSSRWGLEAGRAPSAVEDATPRVNSFFQLSPRTRSKFLKLADYPCPHMLASKTQNPTENKNTRHLLHGTIWWPSISVQSSLNEDCSHDPHATARLRQDPE